MELRFLHFHDGRRVCVKTEEVNASTVQEGDWLLYEDTTEDDFFIDRYDGCNTENGQHHYTTLLNYYGKPQSKEDRCHTFYVLWKKIIALDEGIAIMLKYPKVYEELNSL